MQLLVGFALAAVIAYLARLAGSLSRDGAIAAACIGTVVYGLGVGNGRRCYWSSFSVPLSSASHYGVEAAPPRRGMQKALVVMRARCWAMGRSRLLGSLSMQPLLNRTCPGSGTLPPWLQ
jgi:hypothetical protein